VRPPFTYYGGKMGLARRIVDLLPPHRSFIEPFAGSLAVLFAKHPARHEIINDRDDALVAFWRVLRDRPGDLERVCALTPHARTEFDAADLDAAVDDLELARRFWVRVNQSFAKTSGQRTGWSITTARSQSVPGSILGRLGRFSAAAERLAGVSIEHCDAAELVDRLATPDTVIYADPPYVHATRQRDGVGKGGDYRHEMTDAGHRRLADALRATPATVVLSGYAGDLYDDLYGDWWHCDFAVTAHSSHAVATSRAGRVERIWSNRDLAGGRLPWGVDQRGGAA
jgi:DNA adenine methylase